MEILVSFVSDWPALAFMGRTMIASVTPGRIRKNTPRAFFGFGLGSVEAKRSSP
ncbi:hypothetical protein [Granulicella sp. S156]|uniref:hypothetical protein n=1 Tax=Granulicella sp. S156 TaxID=1747224 RepID=UPI00131E15B6|nr:hypothetical protein [Granulicella sp. S156]